MANITTNELAEALGTTGREVRKFLRNITPKDEQPGKGSRWAIPGTKRDLAKLQKQYDAWHKEKLDAQAAAETAKHEVEEIEVDETE